MNRRDYKLIACAILTSRGADGSIWNDDRQAAERAGASRQWRIMAETIAHYLANDNPRFNRDTFLSACGVAS